MGSKTCNLTSQLSCKKLPSEVINSIRSGTTISSVSKCVEELVLNSIDAKATNIEVSVNLETFKVKVQDNGQGITKEDLAVIGERYWTSKCHSLQDLDINVNQYGFRGEALSSIISVSTGVEVRTSYGNSHVYSRTIKDGQDSVRIYKTPDFRKSSGCTVYVYGILSSQPVRQNRIDKSLELEEIKKALQVIALINYNVGITLRNDVTGASLFHSYPSRSIKDAYVNFAKPRHGINPHENVIEVDYSQDCIVLKGFVSTEGHATRGLQLIYVNKRFVVRTTLFKLFNVGLLPILGLKGSSKSTQQQTQTPGTFRATTLTSSTSDKYPAFLINVVCPGTEFDFIGDEVKFRNSETVTKAVDGLLNTFKILSSRRNRPEERKNEQLLAGQARIFAVPTKKIHNSNKTKSLANIFKSNINKSNNNNSSNNNNDKDNNDGFKTPSTTFKECIGNEITVNDMKRAIQSKAAVRGRNESTPHNNNNDNNKIQLKSDVRKKNERTPCNNDNNNKIIKRKTTESLDESESVRKSPKILNDSSDGQKVGDHCSNVNNNQISQRLLLPKTHSSSSSLCSHLSRPGSSTSTYTPISSVTSLKLNNQQNTSQFQYSITEKSPLCSITSRVTKRKVPAQLDIIVQRRRINQNDTSKALNLIDQPSKHLLDAKKPKLAIQDILDAVWMKRKTPQKTSEKNKNAQTDNPYPIIESPKLNTSRQNLYQPTGTHNISIDEGKRRQQQLVPSPVISGGDYEVFPLLPRSIESHKNYIIHHSQVEQEQYDQLPSVSNIKMHDTYHHNHLHDTEQEENNSPQYFDHSKELIKSSDSNRVIQDFEEQQEMNNKKNMSYHSNEQVEMNKNSNQIEEPNNSIHIEDEEEEEAEGRTNNQSDTEAEQGPIKTSTGHTQNKEEVEVIDIFDDSECPEKSIMNYNEYDDTENDQVDEDFYAVSSEMYYSCYPECSRVDKIKSEFGELCPWNENKINNESNEKNEPSISSQESTYSDTHEMNTQRQKTMNTSITNSRSSRSDDDVSVFDNNSEGMDFIDLCHTFTNDSQDDTASQYFNDDEQVTAEKVVPSIENTDLSNVVNVPSPIAEQFLKEDENLDNEKSIHFEAAQCLNNIPNSNPNELSSPNKEKLTQDGNERNEEQEEKEETDEEIFENSPLVFMNNHDNNNIVDDGNIQVNFVSQQSSILSFPTPEHEEQLIIDNRRNEELDEEKEEEEEEQTQSQEKKQQFESPLIIQQYNTETTPTEYPSPNNNDDDVNMNDIDDIEDNTLVNVDDDDLEQDSRQLESSYFNFNNINDNAVTSKYDHTDSKKTPQQMKVIHNKAASSSSRMVQNKIFDSCGKQQQDVVDNCLNKINQQPLANFRRAWLKNLMPETAKVFGQKRKHEETPNRINIMTSAKRNATYFERIGRMGNINLAANDNLLVGDAIRSVMSHNDDDLVLNKWRNYNMSEVQPTITSLVENYSTQYNCEDEWSIPKGHLELPIINLNNAQELNLMCKKMNSVKTSCRFSKEDISRVQVIGNIDCKFIAATVTILQPSFGNLSVAVADTEKEPQTMLVLFDQHAVHERVLLEQYIQDTFQEVAGGEKEIRTASLNVPMMMDFADFEVRILQAYEKEFQTLGIHVEILSSQTVKVLTVPTCFIWKVEKEPTCNQLNSIRKLTQSLIQEEVQHIKQTNGTTSMYPKTVMDALKSLACRRAVKFGDPLTREESESMINDLKDCKVPFQCAHGRPVLVPLISLNT